MECGVWNKRNWGPELRILIPHLAWVPFKAITNKPYSSNQHVKKCSLSAVLFFYY
jgi:hypothetical protein